MTKPFCTLVVARLASSLKRPLLQVPVSLSDLVHLASLMLHVSFWWLKSKGWWARPAACASSATETSMDALRGPPWITCHHYRRRAQECSFEILLWGGGGGNGVGREPGICDGRMPLSTGQTNSVPPKRCDTPCLAQERPKLHNICMIVRCRSPGGQRHRTVMSPPSKESR